MTKYFLSIFLLFVSLTLLFFACATTAPVPMAKSQLTYTYAKLKLLDLDQMSELIQEKLNLYKEKPSEQLLFDAIIICLSRPNEDGLVDKLIENIQDTADSDERWQRLIEAVVDQAVTVLSTPPEQELIASEDQLTYLILLENLIAEFRPEFIKQYQSPRLESKIIAKIAAAKIVVSPAAFDEGQLNLMRIQRSPSVVAQSLIDEKLNKKLKKSK